MKQTIGEFLATLRKAKGFTQEEVAFKLNISNKTLSSWETDRTTPDALTLPAIADLYGVTVDEILRGERSNFNTGEQTQISDTAKLALTKKKCGKFYIKHFMFTAFGLLAIVLNILGFAFLVYTSIDLWVGITLSIIGFCALVTLSILLIFFERTTLLSEGIISNENENEKSNALAISLKCKNAVSLIIFSLPYLIFSFATLIYFLIAGGVYTVELNSISVTIDRTGVFIGFICAAFVIGFAYLTTGVIYGTRAIRCFCNETQKTNHTKNKKLFTILGSICAGIIGLCIVAPIVFSFVTIDTFNEMWIEGIEATKLHTTDFESFKTSSQTLILDDDTVAELGLSNNKFVLELPENWKEGYEEYLTDLGNGFYGTTYSNPQYHNCPYEIMYKHFEPGYEDPTYTTVAEGTIVKIYHNEQLTEYDYVLYLPTHISEKHILSIKPNGEENYYDNSRFLITYWEGDCVTKNFETGEYGLYVHTHTDVSKLAWFTFAMVSSLSIIICTSIYFAKRKKQNYKI